VSRVSRMRDDVVVGVDVGTTAVKVVAFTAYGEPLSSWTTPLTTRRPRDGWVEQDPDDWWRACADGLRTVTAGLPAGAVRAVGVVSQVNTHLLTDAALRPLGPAIVWQDTRCAATARELDARYTTAEKTRLWGAPVTLDASYLPARALWFEAERPLQWAAARWLLSPKDYVTAKLTGRVATDRLTSVRLVDASGAVYLEDAVAAVDGLAARLPPLRDPAETLGPVTDPGLGCGAAPVVVGTMDAYGAFLGSALTAPGRGSVGCGTSLVVAGTAAAGAGEGPPRTGPGVVAFPRVGAVRVVAGPTQAGGDALRWWAGASGTTTEAALAECAAAEPAPTGIVFTPHLMGERAPLWDADVRGAFLGVGSGATRPALTRAVLEGVAMSARHVLAEVEAACGPLEPVTLTGGGSRSDLWAQIHADVLARPVARLVVGHAGALGAALLGAVGAGLHPDMEAAADRSVGVERVFIPDLTAAGRLDGLYAAYRESYDALKGVHASLAEWRARHL
jgi:xylulokinase